jgi:hypothetical protein
VTTTVKSPRTAVQERGLALVSLILLLALAVVGIPVWKTFTQLGLVPANAFDAGGDLARAADATMAFHQLLIDHAGKWQVNSQGTISTRDRDLNSQIFSKRAAFDREAQRLMESVNTLGAGAKAPEPTKK